MLRHLDYSLLSWAINGKVGTCSSRVAWLTKGEVAMVYNEVLSNKELRPISYLHRPSISEEIAFTYKSL